MRKKKSVVGKEESRQTASASALIVAKPKEIAPLPEKERRAARLERKAEYYANAMGGATAELVNTTMFMLRTADTMTPGSLGRAREVDNVAKLMGEGRQMMMASLEFMKYAGGGEASRKQLEEVEYYK